MSMNFKEENKTQKIKLEDRIAMHRRMAESYHSVYTQKSVKDGATYDEWKFAADCPCTGLLILVIMSLSCVHILFP